MSLGTVVLTGAAGRIGSVLREPLRREAERLVLVDRVPLTAEAPNEEARTADLTDPGAAVPLVEGADGIVHLAGVPGEAPLPDLVEGNVLATHHVLEAARRAGVRRVVLASSNHLTGHYPRSRRVSPDLPPRPDGLYGVSKVAVEALGRLYADRFGLQVVCLRIGSFEAEPTESRHLATWLSHRDGAGFVRAALTLPGVDFLTVYAVSDNSRRLWELSDEIGYVPRDDAEEYAARIPDADAFFTGDPIQGGDPAGSGAASRRAAGAACRGA
ncbi:NAD(P)-dependent oxidoreductase [Actinomadura kijaniata]|uniref:Uronate dehydrogenase n=1 Tax=Actinomadura namibiensis TaxID=182080 RepID=A0A7W3QKB3_ACTNM|nr:NAD(P)-dependent oxidoreductase [Actinomadura namibiensis]MBA8950354.1 uronate dehydrogenase [Actinomadura namibiensis]